MTASNPSLSCPSSIRRKLRQSVNTPESDSQEPADRSLIPLNGDFSNLRLIIRNHNSRIVRMTAGRLHIPRNDVELVALSNLLPCLRNCALGSRAGPHEIEHGS